MYMSKNFSEPRDVTIVLRPHLLWNFNQRSPQYLTGVDKIDKVIIQRLKKDHTGVKNIFAHHELAHLVLKKYFFNTKDGLIYLKYVKEDKEPFTSEDYAEFQREVDDGPDTWMGGNITIYEGKELEETGRKFKNNNYRVELAVTLIDVLPHLTKKKTSKVGAKKTSKTGAKKTSKVGAKKTSKVGAKKKSKVGAKKTSKAGAKKKSKVGAKKKSKAGAKKKKVIKKELIETTESDGIEFFGGGTDDETSTQNEKNYRNAFNGNMINGGRKK